MCIKIVINGQIGDYLIFLEQSTGNRKTRARIPAQSKASILPQKDFKLF